MTCRRLNFPMGCAIGRKWEIYAKKGLFPIYIYINAKKESNFVRYGATGAVLDGVAYGLKLINYLDFYYIKSKSVQKMFRLKNTIKMSENVGFDFIKKKNNKTKRNKELLLNY